MKKWPYKNGTSLEEENLVVFNYISASKICPDKRGGLIRRGLLL